MSAETWMVHDLTEPSSFSGCHFDSFGPFTEVGAREFATQRESYWAHPIGKDCQ